LDFNGIHKKSALGIALRDRINLFTTGSCSLPFFCVSPASDAEDVLVPPAADRKKNLGIFEVVKAPSVKLL
jgi:hypothetical protein